MCIFILGIKLQIQLYRVENPRGHLRALRLNLLPSPPPQRSTMIGLPVMPKGAEGGGEQIYL